jgi:hypothetical protein
MASGDLLRHPHELFSEPSVLRSRRTLTRAQRRAIDMDLTNESTSLQLGNELSTRVRIDPQSQESVTTVFTRSAAYRIPARTPASATLRRVCRNSFGSSTQCVSLNESIDTGRFRLQQDQIKCIVVNNTTAES